MFYRAMLGLVAGGIVGLAIVALAVVYIGKLQYNVHHLRLSIIVTIDVSSDFLAYINHHKD